MKILIHSINYLPELTGIGKFTGEMGSWLAAQGHDLRVVTTPPYYPEWRIPDGYRKYWYASETIAGVRVYRCPFWVPRHLKSWKRILHLASFSLSALSASPRSTRFVSRMGRCLRPAKAKCSCRRFTSRWTRTCAVA